MCRLESSLELLHNEDDQKEEIALMADKVFQRCHVYLEESICEQEEYKRPM